MGLAFAFMLAMGVGALMGSLNGPSQASALAQGGTSSSQTLVATQGNIYPLFFAKGEEMGYLAG